MRGVWDGVERLAWEEEGIANEQQRRIQVKLDGGCMGARNTVLQALAKLPRAYVHPLAFSGAVTAKQSSLHSHCHLSTQISHSQHD